MSAATEAYARLQAAQRDVPAWERDEIEREQRRETEALRIKRKLRTPY